MSAASPQIQATTAALRRAVLALTLAAALATCAKAPGAGAAPAVAAVAIGPHECAACGMVVAEQPFPRGQLVHRDGTRAFFCSLGDLVQYLQAPSPHGKPAGVFVEVAPPTLDPATPATDPQPWRPAEEARYLLGAERRGIMGPPVLSFASARDADAARARLGPLKPHTWSSLVPAVLRAAERPNAGR